MKQNLIATKTFEFSLSIIRLVIELKAEKEFVISKQLMRSATSIGANIEEAIAAQSRRDFVSKLSIAAKEARETKYWLRLLNESAITTKDVATYLAEIGHILNILTKIIKTSQQTISK